MSSQNIKKTPRATRTSSFQRALQKQPLAARALGADAQIPGIAMWEWDIGTDQVHISPGGAALLGLDPMEVGVTAREMLALVHPRDRSKFLHFQLEAARKPSSYLAATLRMRAVKGDWRTVQILGRGMASNPPERTLRVAGSVAVVDGAALNPVPAAANAAHTEKPAQQKPPAGADAPKTSAPEAADAWRKLLDACSDGWWELDTQARIVRAHQHSNGTALKFNEFVGHSLWSLPIFQGAEEQAKSLQEMLGARRELSNFAISAKLPNKNSIELRLHAYPRFDAAGKFAGYIGATQELRRDGSAQRPAAMRDALSMMANQQVLTQRLTKQIAHAQASGHLFALLLIELDRIDSVHASLGPSVVNQVVLEAGQRILRSVRENDTLARIGRGEFLLLLSGLNKPEDTRRAAAAVSRSLSESYAISGQQVSCGSYIGISVFPGDGANADLLLQRARIAILGAKEKGRNSFDFFSHEFVQRTLVQLDLEKDLQLALERKEFALYYQPRINLATGQISGVEALLRWRRAGRELVAPNVFLPIAERLGLMDALGAWIVNEACRQLKEWAEKGLPEFKMAVNISATQIKQGARFVQTVVDALSAAGLKGSALELEINESSLVHDMEEIRGALQEIAVLGVRLSLDDFGTRYSSLSYLKSMPIQMLKIDRSFLLDVERSKRDARIVRAVIDMAHAMDMQVVAEGVESDTQLEVLRELGCDEFQGNWFCPALPASDLTNRILAFAK